MIRLSRISYIPLALVFLLLWPASSKSQPQQLGRISGKVISDQGEPLAGVSITLTGGGVEIARQTSDAEGRFSFDSLLPGSFSLHFEASGASADLQVQVKSSETSEVQQSLPVPPSAAYTTTVYAASRELQQLMDAPSSVTVIPDQDIQLYGVSGQVPSILAEVPGADITQSGLYDFNFNLRGFNTPLNRRVQVFIDGRDSGIPLLGSQDWSSFSLLTDDIQSIQVVTGPSSALYGENAFNGVVDIRTKSPRDSTGGTLRFTFGQLQTALFSGRWSRGLGHGWWLKFDGGYNRSNDFSRSRNVTVEYPGLPLEAIPLVTKHDEITTGLFRLDKYFDDKHRLTFEAGGESLDGPVLVIGTGRAQADAIRTFSRINYEDTHSNIQFYSNSRDSPATPALGSGAPIVEKDWNVELDTQFKKTLWSRLRLIGGTDFGYESINTADSAGIQTLLSHPITTERGGIYGQGEWSMTDSLTLTASGRADASTLHNPQFSPRVALVYRHPRNQSFRISYSEGFQVANYTELFVRVPAGQPLNLSGLEAAFAPLLGGVSLGFNSVPVLGLGNPNLEVEQIKSLEFGYRRAFGSRNLFSVDYYRNWINHFITDLLPDINPMYPPYQAPASLPQPVRSIIDNALNAALPGLTNTPTGGPEIVYSIGNSGRVNSQGVEVDVNHTFGSRLSANASYGWFQFTPLTQPPGVVIHANAPPQSATASLSYSAGKFFAQARYRWVNGFPFANGVFVGPVFTYNVVDLVANYKLTPNWTLGTNVSNLLNNEHYEIFGGDILKRRALGYLEFSWK